MVNFVKLASILFCLALSSAAGATQHEVENDQERIVEAEFIKVAATDRGAGFDHLSDSFKDCLLENTPDRLVQPEEVFKIWDICKNNPLGSWEFDL